MDWNSMLSCAQEINKEFTESFELTIKSIIFNFNRLPLEALSEDYRYIIGKKLSPTFYRLLQNQKLYDVIKSLQHAPSIKEDVTGFFTAYECFFAYRIQLAKQEFESKVSKLETSDPFLKYLRPTIICDDHWDKVNGLLLQKINPYYTNSFDFNGMTAKIYFAVEYRIMYIIRRIFEDAQVIEKSKIQFEDTSDTDYSVVFTNPNYQVNYSYLDNPLKRKNVRNSTIGRERESKLIITFSSAGILSTRTDYDCVSFLIMFETIANWVFGKQRKYAQSIPLTFAKHFLMEYQTEEKKTLDDQEILKLVYGL
ncbi:DgyrCDS9943 [Dimorphilus gyrociliatus]|uniref:DgyrCDS9943 n=1 Tax=Dimorphilus gyrociliatus TaxID=2664684 RepID=A0A7I8W191_9ANNE|nr:DgyrCDS9943 [Dimorphilus gyrociliatus]